MDDLCRVQVLDTAQDLIEEYFNMILRQVLWRNNDFVQIRLHQFGDHVDLLKEVYVRRLKNKLKKNFMLCIGSKIRCLPNLQAIKNPEVFIQI